MIHGKFLQVAYPRTCHCSDFFHMSCFQTKKYPSINSPRTRFSSLSKRNLTGGWLGRLKWALHLPSGAVKETDEFPESSYLLALSFCLQYFSSQRSCDATSTAVEADKKLPSLTYSLLSAEQGSRSAVSPSPWLKCCQW